MRPIFLLRAALAAAFLTFPAHAQISQADIDAAPVCGSVRDLAEGETLLCACKAKGFDRFIWGGGPYSGHSDVCTAARHAGALAAGEGGTVLVTGRPGQKQFEALDRNGITGRHWGMFRTAFDVVPAAAGGASAATGLPACEGFTAETAPYDCACPSGPLVGSVWGSGPYTGDSNVCAAARHAGVLGKAGGGIRVTARPGQDSFEGSTQNGVTTSGWGAYDPTFMVVPLPVAAESGGACGTMPANVEVMSCTCGADAPGGSVWGSGPYTADSALCAAARHAGAIDAAGGTVRVMRVPGLSAYRGTRANGVSTGDWGAYDTSVIFDRN